ncbi:MAG: cytochrome P450, partial [Myxococcota bacterium]
MDEVGPADPRDIFTDNHRWGDVDAWNEAASALHAAGGIHRIERAGFTPFWAVIDHAALIAIERQPRLFTNEPQPVLLPDAFIKERTSAIKSLIHIDDPLHGQLRRMTSDWFKPASIRRMDERLDALSREAVGKLERFGGRCDFSTDVALAYPLQVILGLLGLPDEDYARMLQLTQELFGAEDPDLQRGEIDSNEQLQVILDFNRYFMALTEERRANPTEDLATLIANGRIDGEPLPDLETLGYYIIVATAGHDTTSAAMAGGMQALIEHPDQLAKLQADPALLPNAVEEMIRWTSPVRHFMRTAQEDTEVLGQKIRKGDWLYLSYKGANLDPNVFDEPLRFDIERKNARDQIAFGVGVHFCLGATLARNELRSLFSHVLPRIAEIELDGTPAMTKTTFVGGHKTLPIRY